ncbi:TonB-dependent siderophore receptor [Pseudomonas sp. Gutcm_11s]|uniref:TonB-dependent siderophore receptor n=1 Tax=Pseudomonas sp. Gutcm_11s TaxID=3026088 RepID=UPI002360CC20|nr:TonB-dependent siderophore receptor [Pseudomonas sp. Gutcm_11s]MDD0841754.1 TonB-dependent siderophore receptor [Pseudomonas sp. Gutcm_11s]
MGAPLAIRPLAMAVHLLAAGIAFASPFAMAEQTEAEKAVTLDAASIVDSAEAEDDSVTEGTQSYTTRAANTATPLKMSLRETPQSVTVVTQQRMEDQDLQTITDVVNNTTGISMNRYETSRGQINARGFELNSLMIDGVPTIWEQPWSSGEIFGSLAMYDRVEVVRGANGLMTGAGDPSASLNMVRKRASSRELKGSVEASAGTWDTYGTLGDVSMALNEEGTVRARLVGETNQGDSWIDMNSNERQTYYGTMDIDLTPDTTLWFGLSRQENKTDSPMWGGLPVWYADGSRTHWSRSKTTSADWSKWDSSYETYFVNLDHTFANDWQVNLSYNRGERKADSSLLYLSGNPGKNGSSGMSSFPATYKTETTQDDYSLRLSGPFALLGRDHDLAFGYIHSDQDFDADQVPALTGMGGIPNFDDYNGDFPEPVWGARTDYGSSELEQRGVYAATRLNVTDELKVILGARQTDYEKNGEESGTESRLKDREVTPYAGVVYDLTESLSAYGSYTNIFLPQARRDASGQQLDPIIGDSSELGLKGEWFGGRLNASAAVFQIKQNGLGVATGERFPETFENIYEAADVESKGFELEVSGELVPGWNVSAGYTQFRVEDEDGHDANTLYPTKLLRTFTTYRVPGIFNDKLTIGGGVNWQDSIYTYATNPAGNAEKIEQDAYALVNLMARYEITENLSAQLNANNVTDEKYFDIFDAYGALTYGAPRSLTASAKYSF